MGRTGGDAADDNGLPDLPKAARLFVSTVAAFANLALKKWIGNH